jgi:predicted nucleic acid-binding protein
MKLSMVKKTSAYVDTSAFIALLDRSDSYHTLFRRLFSAPPDLVTSALVIAEGHGWFLRRYDAQRAIQFLSLIDALPNLQIRTLDTTEIAKVGATVKKFSDQNLTLADAHGLTILRDLRMVTCWSTDRHLSLTGAALVI